MKIHLIVIPLLFHFPLFAQLSDTFSDLNFTSNPRWSGDSNFFTINHQLELQSNGPTASGSIYLSSQSLRLENTVWEFYVRLQFDPSTSNYAKFYLASDNQNLNSSVNGYYVKIGGAAGTTDAVDLYKQNNTSATKLIAGRPGVAGKPLNTIRIKVVRDLEGNWELFSDSTGGNNYISEGKTFDNTIQSSEFCGIVCTHTSTRKDQFFWDDIQIKEAPLMALNVNYNSNSSIEVVFNNAIDPITGLSISSYSLGDLQPASVQMKDEKTFTLHFNNSLSNASYSLTFSDLKDIHGNLISIPSIDFVFKKALQYGDLVFTEIYADPDPSNGLPEAEYLELFNNTADTISLQQFTISDLTSTSTISAGKISPYHYVILASTSVATEFELFGKTIGVSPWPSLNNSNDKVELRDDNDNLLHSVDYSNFWHSNSSKNEGGWSLEMINPVHLCKENFNWKSSENSNGGTPGKANSVYNNNLDKQSPKLISCEIIDPTTVTINFDEPIDSTSSQAGFSTQSNTIISYSFNQNRIQLFLQHPLPPNQETLLVIGGIADCLGNSLTDTTIYIFRPGVEDSMDIVINEVLFNPQPNGVDFIEIYNRSSKTLDLKNWEIATFKQDTIYNKIIITDTNFFLNPGNYLAFTTNKNVLGGHFYLPIPDKIIETTSLPSMNDDEGTIGLLNGKGQIIDRFSYSEEMHSPLLEDPEGVSLERISFFNPTNSQYNWHSASSQTGFASPGFENSYHSEGKTNGVFQIQPSIITPNGDNSHDLAFIHYQFPEPGFICSIRLFDTEGRLIKNLVNNKSLGVAGSIYWDGTNESGSQTDTGLYIITIDAFNPTGEQMHFKETIAVANF